MVPLLAQAEDGTRATLRRSEDLVVLTGSELPKLKGLPGDLIRLYASREGKLEPIPFQLDERTPELEYCWRSGADAVKDVDDGRLDDDDELVLRAADAGDRTTTTVPGATARVEVELEDTATHAKAWAYVLAFDDKEHPPPPRSTRRHVTVIAEKTGARFRTESFEIASTGSPGLTGRPTGIAFLASDGTAGPVVLADASRFKLRASYLLGRIERVGDEARSALGSSWIDGPVRIVAPVKLEVYLIWGNWIATTRSYVVMHDHTWELHSRFLVPVNLDRDHPSEATLAFAPGPPGWRTLKANGLLELLGAGGAIGARLELDARLHLRPTDAPELSVDLTDLHKCDEATPYEVTYVLGVLPAGTESALTALMAARDKPLRHAAR